MKILVATDGSKHAEDAVRFLRTLAGIAQCDVKVVAVQMSLVVGMYDELTYATLIEGESQRAAQALERCTAILKEIGISAQTEQGIGHAGDEIVRLAQEWSADLIVVGAKGHSTLERALLGSTSDFVATHAVCSVLVIRPSTRTVGELTKELKVLIPFDDCEAARSTLLEVGEMFSKPSTQVHLLHVIERPALHDETIRYDPVWYDKIQQTMNDCKPLLGAILSSQATVEVVEAGYVSEKICDDLRENKYDIAAIGERGRSTISRIFLGSNSRYILRHAPCSVLLVR